jgi:molybdopterin/thiamine biosynthesis adenylyltransferase
MGVGKFLIFDDDFIEAHNLPNQFYRPEDLGKPKVEALREMMEAFSPSVQVDTAAERYTQGTLLNGIVISAVDSMASRMAIWKTVKSNSERVPFYVEARMGAEFLRLYSFVPGNRELTTWYESMLYPDSEAVEATCTERAIMYTVMVAAGLIADQVKRHIRGEEVKKEILLDLQELKLVAS